MASSPWCSYHLSPPGRSLCSGRRKGHLEGSPLLRLLAPSRLSQGGSPGKGAGGGAGAGEGLEGLALSWDDGPGGGVRVRRLEVSKAFYLYPFIPIAPMFLGHISHLPDTPAFRSSSVM